MDEKHKNKMLNNADEIYNLIQDNNYKQAIISCLDLALKLKGEK